jgi:hypothetical protein
MAQEVESPDSNPVPEGFKAVVSKTEFQISTPPE